MTDLTQQPRRNVDPGLDVQAPFFEEIPQQQPQIQGPPLPPGFVPPGLKYEKVPPGFQPPPVTPDEHPLWGELRRAWQADDPYQTEVAFKKLIAEIQQIANQQTMEDVKMMASAGMLQQFEADQMQQAFGQDAEAEMGAMLQGISFADVRAPESRAAYQDWAANFEGRLGAEVPQQWPEVRQTMQRQMEIGASLQTDEKQIMNALRGGSTTGESVAASLVYGLTAGFAGESGNPGEMALTRLDKMIDPIVSERYRKLQIFGGGPIPEDQYKRLLKASVTEELAKAIESDPAFKETGLAEKLRLAAEFGGMMMPLSAELKAGTVVGKGAGGFIARNLLRAGKGSMVEFGAKGLGLLAGVGGAAYGGELIKPTPPDVKRWVETLPPEKRDAALAWEKHERATMMAATLPLFVLYGGGLGAVGGRVGGSIAGRFGEFLGGAAGEGMGLTAAGEVGQAVGDQIKEWAQQSDPQDLLGPVGDAIRQQVMVGGRGLTGPIARLGRAQNLADVYHGLLDFFNESSPAIAGLAAFKMVTGISLRSGGKLNLTEEQIAQMRKSALKDLTEMPDDLVRETLQTEMGLTEPTGEDISAYRTLTKEGQPAGPVDVAAFKAAGRAKIESDAAALRMQISPEEKLTQAIGPEEAQKRISQRQEMERATGGDKTMQARAARLDEMAGREGTSKADRTELRQRAAALREQARKPEPREPSPEEGPIAYAVEQATEIAHPERRQKVAETLLEEERGPVGEARRAEESVRAAMEKVPAEGTPSKLRRGLLAVSEAFDKVAKPGMRVTDVNGNDLTLIRKGDTPGQWLVQGPGDAQRMFSARDLPKDVSIKPAGGAVPAEKPPVAAQVRAERLSAGDQTKAGPTLTEAQTKVYEALTEGRQPHLRGAALRRTLDALKKRGILDEQGQPTADAEAIVKGSAARDEAAKVRQETTEGQVERAGVAEGKPVHETEKAPKPKAPQSNAGRRMRQQKLYAGRTKVKVGKLEVTDEGKHYAPVFLDGTLSSRYRLVQTADGKWVLKDGEKSLTSPAGLKEARKLAKQAVTGNESALAGGDAIDSQERPGGPFHVEPENSTPLIQAEDFARKAMHDPGSREANLVAARAETLPYESEARRKAEALYQLIHEQAESEPPETLGDMVRDIASDLRETKSNIEAVAEADRSTLWQSFIARNEDLFRGPASVAARYFPRGVELVRDIMRMHGTGDGQEGVVHTDVLNAVSWIKAIPRVFRLFWEGAGEDILASALNDPKMVFRGMARVRWWRRWVAQPSQVYGRAATEMIEMQARAMSELKHWTMVVFAKKGIIGWVKPGSEDAAMISRLLHKLEDPYGKMSDAEGEALWASATPQQRIAAKRMRKLYDNLIRAYKETLPEARAIAQSIQSLKSDIEYQQGVLRDTQKRHREASALAEAAPETPEMESIRRLLPEGKDLKRIDKLAKDRKALASASAREQRQVADLKRLVDLGIARTERLRQSGGYAEPKQYEKHMRQLEGWIKRKSQTYGNLLKEWNTFRNRVDIATYNRIIAKPREHYPRSLWGHAWDLAHGLIHGRAEEGVAGARGPSGRRRGRTRPEEAAYKHRSWVWKSILAPRKGTGEPLTYDITTEISDYLPQYIHVTHGNQWLARWQEALVGKQRLVQETTRTVMRDGEEKVIDTHEAYEPNQEVILEGQAMRSLGLARQKRVKGGVIWEPLSALYREEKFAEGRKQAVEKHRRVRRGRIAADLPPGKRSTAMERVLLVPATSKVTMKDLSDPKKVARLQYSREGTFGPERASQLISLGKDEARHVLRVYQGGWRDQALRLAEGPYIVRDLVDYINENMYGGPVKPELTQGIKGITRGVIEPQPDVGGYINNTVKEALAFANTYVSAHILGGPTNIHNALNAAGGAYLLSKALLRRPLKGGTLSALRKLDAGLRKMRKADVDLLLRMENLNERDVGDSRWIDMVPEMESFFMPPAEKLEAMTEKQRKGEILEAEALAAFARSGSFGVMRGDMLPGLLEIAQNRGPTGVKRLKSPDKLSVTTALRAINDVYWAPFNTGERMVRASTYLDEYIRSRNAGYTSDQAASRAFAMVHQTQMVYSKAAKSRFLRSAPGMLFGNLGTWGYNFQSAIGQMPWHQQIRFAAGTMAMAIVGWELGVDLFDVLGNRLSNLTFLPGARDMYRTALGLHDEEPHGFFYEHGRDFPLPLYAIVGFSPIAQLIFEPGARALEDVENGDWHGAKRQVSLIGRRLMPQYATFIRQFGKANIAPEITNMGVPMVPTGKDDGTYFYTDPVTGKTSNERMGTGAVEWLRQQTAGNLTWYATRAHDIGIELERQRIIAGRRANVQGLMQSMADIKVQAGGRPLTAAEKLEQQELFKEAKAGAAGTELEGRFKSRSELRQWGARLTKTGKMKKLPSNLRVIANLDTKQQKFEALARNVEQYGISEETLRLFLETQTSDPRSWLRDRVTVKPETQRRLLDVLRRATNTRQRSPAPQRR